MTIRSRLGSVARAARRAGRMVTESISGAGPQAVYARILDGEHLWLAVPAGVGRPSLWDEANGLPVPAVDDLPADHLEHDPSAMSVRWRLTNAIPEHDGAEVQVVLLREDDDPVPLQPPDHPPSSHLRVPTTVDGQWRFELTGRRGSLRVRRSSAMRAAVLCEVRESSSAITIVCTAGLEGPSELAFVHDETVSRALPMTSENGRLMIELGATDLPIHAGRYQVVIAAAGERLPITRSRNGVFLEDRTSALMPLVVDVEHEMAARFHFNRSGELFLVRRMAGGVATAEVLG